MSCFFLYMCKPLSLPDWKISLCFSLSLTHAHTHTHNMLTHIHSGTQITSLSIFVGLLSLCKNNQDDNLKKKEFERNIFLPLLLSGCLPAN